MSLCLPPPRCGWGSCLADSCPGVVDYWCAEENMRCFHSVSVAPCCRGSLAQQRDMGELGVMVSCVLWRPFACKFSVW